MLHAAGFTPRLLSPVDQEALPSFGIGLTTTMYSMVYGALLKGLPYPNGDRIVTAYSNQRRAAIPSSTFEFKPPTGTEVTTPLGQ